MTRYFKATDGVVTVSRGAAACLGHNRAHLRQAIARAEQPALFELREDHRPPGERSAAERYRKPSLFSERERGR